MQMLNDIFYEGALHLFLRPDWGIAIIILYLAIMRKRGAWKALWILAGFLFALSTTWNLTETSAGTPYNFFYLFAFFGFGFVLFLYLLFLYTVTSQTD